MPNVVDTQYTTNKYSCVFEDIYTYYIDLVILINTKGKKHLKTSESLVPAAQNTPRLNYKLINKVRESHLCLF